MTPDSSAYWAVGNACSYWSFLFPGSSGGICEKSKLYSDGKKKSLNTGIITVQNYASHVPPKVSHITFAHEVGHNFGSPVSLLHASDSGTCGGSNQAAHFVPVLLSFSEILLLIFSMTLDPSAHRGSPKAKT